MGVRIVVRDGESMPQALRRLKMKLQLSRLVARRRDYPDDGTQQRRAKQFRKRFKARRATLVAQQAGEQPVESIAAARRRFWERTGKP